jgi:hypothetical protein
MIHRREGVGGYVLLSGLKTVDLVILKLNLSEIFHMEGQHG